MGIEIQSARHRKGASARRSLAVAHYPCRDRFPTSLRFFRMVAGLLILGSPLLAQRPPGFDKRVSEALDKVRPLMLDRLGSLEKGRLALACHALLNDGVTLEEPLLAAALQRLAEAELVQSYALSLRLMVIQEHRAWPKRLKSAKRDCARLLKAQVRGGGFTYHSGKGRSDLSNTQYAALGLRAAHSVGVPISRKRWERLASYALKQQDKKGGGHYSKKSGSGTPSMTMAVVAVMEICKPHLTKGSLLHRRSQKGIEAAWRWMEQHRSAIGADKVSSMNSYYFHYGLERAAILSSVFDVGNVDWYLTGAEMMLRQQSPGGGWSSQIRLPRKGKGLAARLPFEDIQTSFAILFLRRRFQQSLQAVTTEGNQIRALFLPEEANKAQIEGSVRGEVSRGYRAVPGLIKALRSQYQSRRKAAVLALIRITGRFEDLSPYVLPEDNAESLHAIEAWWMREGRKKLDGGPKHGGVPQPGSVHKPGSVPKPGKGSSK